MRVIRILCMAIAIMLFAFTKTISQTTIVTDICVYGGTSAGVISAYTAKKLGKNALLIEPGKFLGGMTSGGLGYTDIGNKYTITGIARDFYRRVGQHYGVFEQWIFEPKVATTLFNDYVTRGGFQVVYEYRLKSVTKVNKTITEILLENAVLPNPATDIIVKAKMFIDCGYEGDLMAKAGVSYFVGRENNSVYSETLSGFQIKPSHQFPEGIDPYIIPGQPASGLVWGVTNGPVSPMGTGDSKMQAYNFRLCLTTNAQNRLPITQPADYDPSRYELLLRLFAAAPAKKALANYFIISKMPNNKTDMNNKGGFSTDMIGANYDYPNGSYTQRKQIIQTHENYTKGLLYFLGHDPRVPVQTRNEMLTYGYPADEYVANGNWTPQLYIREARRMVGNYVMTQNNCKGIKVAQDGIALASYNMDSHHAQRIVVDGMVKNEGCVEVGVSPYPVAYNSLVPKPADCNNIFVPVCLSASHIAYGSIRMEPVFMVLGQSAATAASMAIDANVDVHHVDILALQQKLKNDPLADGSLFEVLVDNDEILNTQRTGTWTTQTSGGYGPTFLVNDGVADSTASFKFIPDVPKAGQYEAYMYFPKITGLTTQTKIKVFDGASQTKELIIHESDIRVTGQTTGEWVSLGKYTVPFGKHTSVEVTAKGADGKIVADAVVWIPIIPTDTLRDPENPANTEAGLKYAYYEGVWSALPDFSTITPVESGLISNINLWPKNRDDDYAFKFSGYISVPADGIYTFWTSSDEGSKLLIGDRVVVNNDGLHTAVEKSGQIALNAGKHLFSVLFFERLGAASLTVRYAGPGIQRQVIPNSAYFRLTGAGAKVNVSEEIVAGQNFVLSVYPNPAKKVLKVSVTSAEDNHGAVALKLIDLYGKVIQSQHQETISKGENVFYFDIADEATGIHIVRFENTGHPLSMKVKIEK